MKYINLHTHQFTNNANAIEIVNQYPTTFNDDPHYFSVGIHPWHIIEKNVEAELKFITQKLQDQKCLAIGECGLDKRIDVPFYLQLKVFEAQLQIATLHKKPVIIHCVAAFNELIAVKKRMNLSIPMVVHGFSKNETVAKDLIENGFYISFGKYLMINPKLDSVFLSIPNDRLFLETDSSDFKIEDVYKKASQIKNISIEKLQLQVQNNFDYVFMKSNNKFVLHERRKDRRINDF